MQRIVEVLIRDEVPISYPIKIEHFNMRPPTDDDFIQAARANLIANGYRAAVVLSASFVVRESDAFCLPPVRPRSARIGGSL